MASHRGAGPRLPPPGAAGTDRDSSFCLGDRAAGISVRVTGFGGEGDREFAARVRAGLKAGAISIATAGP